MLITYFEEVVQWIDGGTERRREDRMGGGGGGTCGGLGKGGREGG